jgi:signal transduction histidine kinase
MIALVIFRVQVTETFWTAEYQEAPVFLPKGTWTETDVKPIRVCTQPRHRCGYYRPTHTIMRITHFPCGSLMPVRLNLKRLAATVVFAVVIVAVANATVPTPKRVLLVYQNNGYSPAALEFQQSVLAGLREALGQDLEFYCEQLDWNRLPESREQGLEWVRSRYVAHGIDVIIVFGTVPTDILPGVPVVYVGNLRSELNSHNSDRQNSVAVWYQVDVRKTLAVARRLQPKAGNVLVIAGSGLNDRIYLGEVRDQLKGSDVQIEYVDNETIDELKVRVSHLSHETIVLPIAYTRDRNGKSYYGRDAVAQLSQVSTAPVYATSDTFIGVGTVGGYVVNFSKTGKVVTNVVLQILAGKTAAQVIVSPEGTSAYEFDWRQLKRWNFSERSLPSGSIVQYRTQSAWEQYRWRIVGIVALVVAQFFLILRLLVTQKKQDIAEAALRDMTGRLLESQDEERRRFARDLHDGTGQHLSAVALAISQVLAKFPAGYDALRRLLQDSHSASRQALDEVRIVSFALHPPLLDGIGLVAAARWYVNGLQKRTDLRIDFEAPAEIKHLAPEAERALFRILQESMSNVLRHAKGDMMSVVLSSRGKSVILEIEDDGRGMSTEELAQAEGAAALGVGIAGMRERLRQLEGTLKIHSSASGTRVTATVPVDEERYAAAHSAGR